jgi:hypothetical protein
MLLRQHQFLPRYDAQSGPRPISCVGCGGLRARMVDRPCHRSYGLGLPTSIYRGSVLCAPHAEIICYEGRTLERLTGVGGGRDVWSDWHRGRGLRPQ